MEPKSTGMFPAANETLLITLDTSFTDLSQVSIESGSFLDHNNNPHDLMLLDSCHDQPSPPQGGAGRTKDTVVVSLDIDLDGTLVINYTSDVETTFMVLVLASDGSEAADFSEQDPGFGKIYDAFDNVNVAGGVVSRRELDWYNGP